MEYKSSMFQEKTNYIIISIETENPIFFTFKYKKPNWIQAEIVKYICTRKNTENFGYVVV